MPPVQQTLENWGGVTELVGERIFQQIVLDESKTKDASGNQLSYIVWSIISSIPNNNLSDPPDDDDQLVQIDCYSAFQTSARILSERALAAMEGVTHVVRGPEPLFEPDTKLFRWSLDAEFFIAREN
jgi:hypothetical protein